MINENTRESFWKEWLTSRNAILIRIKMLQKATKTTWLCWKFWAVAVTFFPIYRITCALTNLGASLNLHKITTNKSKTSPKMPQEWIFSQNPNPKKKNPHKITRWFTQRSPTTKEFNGSKKINKHVFFFHVVPQLTKVMCFPVKWKTQILYDDSVSNSRVCYFICSPENITKKMGGCSHHLSPLSWWLKKQPTTLRNLFPQTKRTFQRFNRRKRKLSWNRPGNSVRPQKPKPEVCRKDASMGYAHHGSLSTESLNWEFGWIWTLHPRSLTASLPLKNSAWKTNSPCFLPSPSGGLWAGFSSIIRNYVIISLLPSQLPVRFPFGGSHGLLGDCDI